MPSEPSSGIRVGKGWVQAFYSGSPIAGLSYKEANAYKDGGRRWLYSVISNHWSPSIADVVLGSGVTLDKRNG